MAGEYAGTVVKPVIRPMTRVSAALKGNNNSEKVYHTAFCVSLTQLMCISAE